MDPAQGIEERPHAVFVSDFVHFRTPLERQVTFVAGGEAPLRQVLEEAAASVAVGPGSGRPLWSAHAVVGQRRLHPRGSAIDVAWIPNGAASPVHRVDAIISVEASGLDNARLDIQAGAGVVANREGDAQWLAEELCRAVLTSLRIDGGARNDFERLGRSA